MNENKDQVGTPSGPGSVRHPVLGLHSTDPQPVRRGRRRLLWGGVIVVAALALTAAGAIAAPLITHQAEVAEYRSTVSELESVRVEAAQVDLSARAAGVLLELQQVEASTHAEQLESLVATPAGILPASTQASLLDAAAAVREVLPVPPGDIVLSRDAQEVVDRTDETEGVAPLWVGSEPATIAKLLEWEAEPVEHRVVDEADVSSVVLAEVRAELADAGSVLESAEQRVQSFEGQLARLDAAVAGTWPVLAGLAKALPDQATVFLAEHDRAGESTSQATSAAATAAEVAVATAFEEDENGRIVPASPGSPGTFDMAESQHAVLIRDAISAYVVAATSAASAHSVAVAAEEAAAAEAEALAAGAGGYVDPSTGVWTPTSSGGGGAPPPASGGGGYVPPTSGGGGGTSVPPSSGGGGCWYDPLGFYQCPGQCPVPPPGYVPTGGTANGCPTYAPWESGGADDW